MAHGPVYAPRDVNGVVSDSQDVSTAGRISFVPQSTSSGPATIIAASALTTYTINVSSTVVSSGQTYTEVQSIPTVISNAADLSSLSSAGAFNTQTSSSTSTSGAAAATSSAASTHQSPHSTTSTLIPAIVVPVAIVLLASFIAFFFFMRRRHHQELEGEGRFEKAQHNPPRSSPTNNNNNSGNSSRNLLPPGAIYGQGADEKAKQSAHVEVKALAARPATGPTRPRRSEESDIPSSAIGLARSTSLAEAVYPPGGVRPPRSAHEMRGLDPRGPRAHVISSGDIIDSYAEMRPSTAPSRSKKDYSSRSEVMRTPLPVKPMGRPPPKNTKPQFTPNTTAQSLSAHTASPALWSPPSFAHEGPALSRAPTGTPDGSYDLTEENMRIARLGTGKRSARQTPDNTSISDVDEHDHARAHRDDGSEISDLDEEQEWMASGVNSPMGTGRGTPTSGRIGTPMSGKAFVR